MNVDSRVLTVAAGRQHGLITRRQATELDFSPRTIGRRVASGDWVPVFRGVFRLAGFPTTFEQRLLAACLSIGPDAVASHRGAAALMGVPNQPRWVEVTVPRARKPRTEEVLVHLGRSLATGDVHALRGVPTTTPVRTLVDLAELRPYDGGRLGAILDYLAARRLVCRPELEALAERLRATCPHVQRIDALLAGRPEKGRPLGSEFEAMLLPPLQKAGVALPEPQYRLILTDGSEIFLDFAYPQWRLALEADSYLWHSSKEAWRRDRQRNNEVMAMGWTILPITWDMMRYKGEQTAQLIARAIAARAA